MAVAAVVRLETSTTDMTQGNLFIIFVLVRQLLGALLLVEFNANIMLLHIVFRDSFDVGSSTRTSSTATTFAGATALLYETGRRCTLLEGMLLWCDGEVDLDI